MVISYNINEITQLNWSDIVGQYVSLRLEPQQYFHKISTSIDIKQLKYISSNGSDYTHTEQVSQLPEF